MDLLFSFLEPNRPHSAFLAGYFGKVSESWFCINLQCTMANFSCTAVLAKWFASLFFHAVGCDLSHVAEDNPANELCPSKQNIQVTFARAKFVSISCYLICFPFKFKFVWNRSTCLGGITPSSEMKYLYGIATFFTWKMDILIVQFKILIIISFWSYLVVLIMSKRR